VSTSLLQPYTLAGSSRADAFTHPPLLAPFCMIVVDFAPSIDIAQLTPNLRVALRSDSCTSSICCQRRTRRATDDASATLSPFADQLHSILPTKQDPLVALMMVEKVPDSTYDMVGGLDQQIKEIKEVIELPVKHPELFDALGIAQPKGVLLYGPPGTGKTLLARAVAHHTDCKFIRVSGSELVQKYIGEGSRMVRCVAVLSTLSLRAHRSSHLTGARAVRHGPRARPFPHLHGRD